MCDGPGRGDQLPVPHRRALREAPRRRRRARSSSTARSCSVRSITSRRSIALEGHQERRARSARRRRGARAGLRRDRRLAAPHQRARGPGRARGRSVPEGRAAAPHRAPLRGGAREPRTRVRHVRARARARQRQRGVAPEPRAPGDDRRTLARRSRSSTTPSSTSSRDEPERFVELGLRLAQIFEVQLEDVDNAIARYRRVLEVEPENQVAVRSLDRLFTQTERWAELAAILEREAEIGQTPDEILEFKYRLGQVYQQRASATSTRPSRPTARCSARRPSTTTTLERPRRRSSRRGTEAARDRRDPRAALPAAGEWEKLAGVLEAQLAHTSRDAETTTSASAVYYRIAELHEEQLLDPVRALDVYVRALKEFPLDEKRGEEIERLAGIDRRRLGDRSPTRTPTSSACTTTRTSSAPSAVASRASFEEELGDVDKAEETYRYVLTVEPLDTEALANLDRIYIVARAVAGARAGILEQRVARRRPTTSSWSSSTAASARSTRSASATSRRRDPRVPSHLRRARRRTRRRSGARAHLPAQGARGRSSTTVYERELENASGDVAGGRDPREARAPRRRAARTIRSARSTRWKRRARSAR